MNDQTQSEEVDPSVLEMKPGTGNVEASNLDQVEDLAGSADQPTEESHQEQVIEVDGESYSPDQLKEYISKGKDYTQKTQALAEDRRVFEEQQRELARLSEGKTYSQPATQEVDPNVQAAIDTLKAHGVATKEDLAYMQAMQEDEKSFNKYVQDNPGINQSLLRDLGKANPDMAYADIAAKYNLTSKGDKLEKAKSSRAVVGHNDLSDAPKKSFMDLSEKEYDAWKKANINPYSSGKFKSTK